MPSHRWLHDPKISVFDLAWIRANPVTTTTIDRPAATASVSTPPVWDPIRGRVAGGTRAEFVPRGRVADLRDNRAGADHS